MYRYLKQQYAKFHASDLPPKHVSLDWARKLNGLEKVDSDLHEGALTEDCWSDAESAPHQR